MRPLRLGTRGSRLALRQAEAVAGALAATRPGAPEPEIVVVETSGDRVRDRPLAETGGKGLFAKEIDAALLDGRIDAAAHSAKDVETRSPDGVALAAFLPRGDPRDALLSPVASRLADLPVGARVGTASVRRRAQILSVGPGLRVVMLRGNVDTRIARLASGAMEAAVLAVAGLERLGRADEIAAVLDPEAMLPAAGQGAVVVACRADDGDVARRLSAIDHPATRAEVTAERAVLARLDGSCRTPIAALARAGGGRLELRAMVLSADGSRRVVRSAAGPIGEPEALGAGVGEALVAGGAGGLLARAGAGR